MLEAEVFDTKVEATYEFKIEAIAEGGAKLVTNKKTLTYKCLNNVFIQQPFDFNPNYFSYKMSSGSTKVYGFSDFISQHYLCPIEKYELDNNNDYTSINPPAKASFDPNCVTLYGNLCKEVNVKVDQYGTYDFWVVATARGGAKKSFKVTVTVDCGDEVVSVNPTEIVKYYPLDSMWNTPINVHASNTLPSFKSAFTVTHQYGCNFNNYKVWADENGTIAVDGNITLNNGNDENNANINLLDHIPLNHKIFYIQFVSDGGVKKMLKYDYTICGYEKVHTYAKETKDYWYQRTDVDQNRTIEYSLLDPLYWFDLGGSANGCLNETLVFYTDKYCITEWKNPTPKRVELQSDGNGKQRIYHYTNVSFPYTELWLCRKTLGNNYAAVPFAFETCGT